MIQGLDHIALAVSDLQRSVDFYCDVLGMRIVDSGSTENAEFYWLNFGVAQTLNLALNPGQTPKALGVELDWSRTPHIAFSAPDATLEVFEKRLDGRGILYKRSATSLYFTDPDGNYLEVTFWREKGLRDAGIPHW